MPTTANGFTYLENFELSSVLQNIVPETTMNDPFFKNLMGIKATDASQVLWDIRDNFTGLTSARAGYDSPYGVVAREGISTFRVNPGVYGDVKAISNAFLTNSREIGMAGEPINIAEAQGSDVLHLVQRAIWRIKKIGWDLVSNGSYSVLGPNGAPVITDTFNINKTVTAVTWADPLNSTPLADLRNFKQQYELGQSASFGRDATIYLHPIDSNHLLANTNPNDLGAKRVITVNAGAQPMTIEDINRYMLEADLPQIAVVDKFYEDDTKTSHYFLTQGTAVLVGKRLMGDPVMQFVFTRNVDMKMGGGDRPKMTKDNASDNWYVETVINPYLKPTEVKTYLGFNGAPAIYYPSAVVSINLAA